MPIRCSIDIGMKNFAWVIFEDDIPTNMGIYTFTKISPISKMLVNNTHTILK